MAEITPLPWHMPHSGAVAGDHDNDGYVIVAVTPTPRSPTGSAHRLQWEANAAFIALAANAHDDLVAALKSARDTLLDLAKDVGGAAWLTDPLHAADGPLGRISAALSKVEAK